MGLLAKEGMLFVLIFVGTIRLTWAGEGPFYLTMVDYFGMKVMKKENAAQGYHPSQVVMDLLDDPNEQTALAYLRWHRERLERIARAQAVIDKVMATVPLEISK